MKNEFTLAFNEVLDDKQLPRDVIIEALEAAMISAYRKAVNASNAQHVVAKIDLESGQVQIFAEKEIVDDVHDDRTEVTLEVARSVDPEAELGGMVVVETTPKNFGRVAAQTARQVIQQRLREAERESQFEFYSKQLGDVINGVVQATNIAQITLGLEKKAEGIMPRKEQIPGERFRVHDRLRALLLEIKETPKGPQITLSRAHRNFLRRLLEDEVPEIYHGMVEIRSIAREPGHRSKVSVAALQPGIDPVGACVGVRGVRIQAIVRELNDEKIDVIEYSADPAEYISKALSPARVLGVYLDKNSKTKTATVVVPEDQLSLAIGRDGQNARLAAKLTSWRIDIKSLPEAAGDALTKVRTDPEYMGIIQPTDEVLVQVENVLAKKAENRPVTPEEYQILNRFVQRVETALVAALEDEKAAAERQRLEAIRSTVPAEAFDTPIDDLALPRRLVISLSGAGYPTVGDLLSQLKTDPDAVLKLNDVGNRTMKEIEDAVEKFLAALAPAPAPEQPAPVEVETPVETVVEEAPAPIEEAPVAEIAEPEPAVVETEAEPAVPDIFSLETINSVAIPEEEETSDETTSDLAGKKKGKKGKKRFAEVEYDPDKDVTLVKRKSKRGGRAEWEDEW